jgi:hypothetical protein
MLQAFVTNPSWPDAYARILENPTESRQSIHAIQGNPDNPYMEQWNVSFDREILPQTSLRVGYVGSRGHNLGRLVDNVAFSVETPQGRFIPLENRNQRRNPNWSEVRIRYFDGSSRYNGLIVALRRRLSQGLQMQASYTYSKSIDDASFQIGQGETNTSSQWTLIPEDPSFDRGLSAFHVGSNFVFSTTYQLPFGSGRTFGSNWTGVQDKLLGGWGVTSILKLAEGTPLTAELGFNPTGDGRAGAGQGLRPDLVAGRSNNPVLGGTDQYFDPTAFSIPEAGYYGNLARNTIIGPGLVNWDFSVMKDTKLNDSLGLQVRLEVFNILNRANFGDPARVVFDSARRVRGNAGRITDTSTAARQIQLGAKLVW